MKRFFITITLAAIYLILAFACVSFIIVGIKEVARLKKDSALTDAYSYNNRGLAYYRKYQYDKAISEFTKAIEINPRYAEAYNNRGLIYRFKDQYDKAVTDYTMAIEINPKFADAYNNRGNAYYWSQYDKVYSDLRQAYEATDQYNKACSDWRRACESGLCEQYELAKRRGLCK